MAKKSGVRRFDELHRRVCGASQHAGVTLAVSERMWRDAQKTDEATWSDIVDEILPCFDDVDEEPSSVVFEIQKTLGFGSRATQDIVGRILRNLGPTGPFASLTLRDMITDRAPWEIDFSNYMFEEMRGTYGDSHRVSLGEGAFGEIFSGLLLQLFLFCEAAKTNWNRSYIFWRTCRRPGSYFFCTSDAGRVCRRGQRHVPSAPSEHWQVLFSSEFCKSS
jgi:hypothetical protein